MHYYGRRLAWGFIFSFLFPAMLIAEPKTWTGYGGDADWANPLNWSGSSLPQPADDVLLDNRDMPVSYLVTLPLIAVTLRTIRIAPSPGRNIELVLPVSNKVVNAFTVTGPGYGIELNAGAVFRNASGLSSGESLSIADSIIIHDGGKYIHQTRSSHANSILKFLSTAPGTEQGVFDFDVPKASYTISVSNRIYGSLELHASAFGSLVNYTCTGANPLLIRGNMRVGAGVNVSMDLSGVNGNIQIDGDYIQEGGQLNLASGSGDNTVLRIKGDLYQLPAATITETNNGSPYIELNGTRLQEIAMAGHIVNQVGFRLKNKMGSVLRLPLLLPWRLDLQQGAITSSLSSMLTLDSVCNIIIDSSLQTGTYVDGPLRKLGLKEENHFLFPVGKFGNLRWLEIKGANGNYTVEYFYQNPASIGTSLGPGLHHISKLEYWSVTEDGPGSNQANIELSFSSAQSGGITDPAFLRVAKFESSQWQDAGQLAITGNFMQGSVLSGNVDFGATDYTLASSVDLENPLPETTINLQVKEISGKPVFCWTLESSEIPDHFELYEDFDHTRALLVSLNASTPQKQYIWKGDYAFTNGVHFYSVSMIDIHGKVYSGKQVLFKKDLGKTGLYWISGAVSGGAGSIMIQSEYPNEWQYEIIAMDGRLLEKGDLKLTKGTTYLCPDMDIYSGTVFIFRAIDSHGNAHHLVFRKK